MITDNLAQYKLDLYSDNILSESEFSNITKKVKDNPEFIVSNIKSMISAVKRNDFNTVSNIAKKFNPSGKKLDVYKTVNTLAQKNPRFKKNYDLAYKVFKNSLPRLKEENLMAGTLLYAGISSLNKDKNYNIKNDLKKIVVETRRRVKTQDEDNDDFADDINKAFAIAIISVTLTLTAALTAVYALITAAPMLAPLGVLIIQWGAVLGVIYLLTLVAKGAKE